MARKGKYGEWLASDGLLRIEGWARDGLTEQQIAKNMRIGERTLTDWKTRFPAISAALKRGKDVVDLEVENALLKRALGYEYTETMVEESVDGVKTRRTKKFIPPDVTAQIFWLKNRKAEVWREKQIVEVSEETLSRAREILGGVSSVIK